MNSYIQYMNRFVSLLIVCFLFLSCKEESVTCEGPYESVSGIPMFGLTSFSSDSIAGSVFLETGSIAVVICNPEIFPEPDGFYLDQILLDSADTDACQECIQIFEWSGPGCDPGHVAMETESPFLSSSWKFDHLVLEEEKLYGPCLNTSQLSFQNNRAIFKVRNEFSPIFELDGDVIRFEKDPIQTLAGVHGYDRVIEETFERLFSETPVRISITGNRLTLTHEENIEFVFYAE
ncbi:MAG: hypothetical protein R8G66_31740 [Cytophagales bacterium]|nr:hypothetical protein [Cytophagales bacterium]